MPLKELLKEMVERNASDLHLVAGSAPIIRINGELTPIGREAEVLGKDTVGKLLEAYLTETQIEALNNRQDVHTSIVSDTFESEQYGRAQRFRVCIFWERNGLSAALRVIPVNIPTFKILGVPPIIEKLTYTKRGLVLIVGPTGSGRTTTVASMIDFINTNRSEHIITIESPIEYALTSKKSLISQREVGTDVESFELGGLSAMGADPDVILLGDLRTPEAVRIALALAETGHLVFATMHAESASEAVRRMIDPFPDARQTMQMMISRSLKAIVGQRLIPRASGTGRSIAMEIMIMDARIQRMIAEGETYLTPAIEAARNVGMQSMDDSVLDLYRKEVISYGVACAYMNDQSRL